MIADWKIRSLTAAGLPAAVALLQGRARDNLLLLDLVRRFGEAPAPGEMAAELLGLYAGAELVGVAALRPIVAVDADFPGAALDLLAPYLEDLQVGLLKGDPAPIERLWSFIRRRRRHRIWVDRLETCFAVDPNSACLSPASPEAIARGADSRDLDDLVFAARESLREEGRPDPFRGDARGFRRWVAGRVARARLLETEAGVVFVGYADVRSAEGWLLQGIYTWPEARRQGFAALGTSALCRETFAAGGDHVQLAVVDGNDPARRLYEGLGFKPYGRLRTILFT
ncbi:MAG: GNAT family N-acetyltransferase [Myxococcota bacterium]